MALDFFAEINFNLRLVLAAASLIRPRDETKDFVKGKSILIPLMGKLFTALWVWAPHKAFCGTFTSPRLSFSILYFIIISLFGILF